MKTGTIWFSGHNSGWIGKGIAYFTNSWMSHTFIIRGKYESKEFITLETTTTIVAQRNFVNEYMTNDCRLMGFEVLDKTEQEQLDAMKKCDSLIGNLYAYLRLLGYIIQHIFFLKNQPIKMGTWCCDITLLYLKSLGYSWAKDLNGWQLDPQDIQQILLSHPESFKYMYFKNYIDKDIHTIS